jgi:hypothetical protein
MDSPRDRVWTYQHEGGYIQIPSDFGTWGEYLAQVQRRVDWWEGYGRERSAESTDPDSED